MGSKGIIKGLNLIISPQILLNYNLNGTNNKKRLKNLKNVMDVFFCKSSNIKQFYNSIIFFQYLIHQTL